MGGSAVRQRASCGSWWGTDTLLAMCTFHISMGHRLPSPHGRFLPCPAPQTPPTHAERQASRGHGVCPFHFGSARAACPADLARDACCCCGGSCSEGRTRTCVLENPQFRSHRDSCRHAVVTNAVPGSAKTLLVLPWMPALGAAFPCLSLLEFMHKVQLSLSLSLPLARLLLLL